MSTVETAPRYRVVDFAEIPGVPCPCGTARRAFADAPEIPATVHVTEISEDAALHYHKRLTETYFFLECQPSARMQLDSDILPVKPGMCILIPVPGGPASGDRQDVKVLIVATPKFDPSDEWLE